MIVARKTPLTLYLIRHGQTEWSRSGQHTGRTDIKLTPEGENKARELVPWLSSLRFGRVLTSPRQRARRTCELAGLGSQAEVDPDLAEWDYGDYEGRLSSDIRQERPGWNVFRDGCPAGEMPDQVSARADRLLVKISELDGCVAIFTHGQFGQALAARWIGLPIVQGQYFLLGTASLSILGYSPGHPDTRVIALWNANPSRFAKDGRFAKDNGIATGGVA